MATGYVTLQGLVSGLGSGSASINLAQLLFASTPQFEIASFPLSGGGNTIGIPAGANAICLIPPAGNVILLTLKGVNGDVGIPIHKTNWTFFTVDATATQFALNAASPVTITLLIL